MSPLGVYNFRAIGQTNSDGTITYEPITSDIGFEPTHYDDLFGGEHESDGDSVETIDLSVDGIPNRDDNGTQVTLSRSRGFRQPSDYAGHPAYLSLWGTPRGDAWNMSGEPSLLHENGFTSDRDVVPSLYERSPSDSGEENRHYPSPRIFEGSYGATVLDGIPSSDESDVSSSGGISVFASNATVHTPRRYRLLRSNGDGEVPFMSLPGLGREEWDIWREGVLHDADTEFEVGGSMD